MQIIEFLNTVLLIPTLEPPLCEHRLRVGSNGGVEGRGDVGGQLGSLRDEVGLHESDISLACCMVGEENFINIRGRC
jgi:hypothetical protein